MSGNRIAICISGQIRSSDERLLEIQREAEEIGADIFISVWENRGGKTFDSGHRTLSLFRIFEPRFAFFFPQVWSDGFRDLFPDWKSILPNRGQVTKIGLEKIFPNSVIEIEPDIPDLDLPGEINSLRMLYKIKKCNQLKRKYEEEHNFKYDRVIRVRPDILLNLEKLVDASCDDRELLVKIRGGQTLHDTYWAGSTTIDDTMANFFDHAQSERLETWRGVHVELADYVQNMEIHPVNIQCAKIGFEEFGSYTAYEQIEIIRNFLTLVDQLKVKSQKSGDFNLANIMTDVLTFARDRISEVENLESPADFHAQFNPKSSASLTSKDFWQALVPISIAHLVDSNTAEPIRGMLAFNTLVSDALLWPSIQPLRSKQIIDNLPEKGSELLPYLFDEKRVYRPPVETRSILALSELWRQRLTQFSDEQVNTAQKRVSRALLGNNYSRGVIAQHLRQTDRLEEQLIFAKLYKTIFPERSNASRFILQAEKLIAESS